MKKQMGFTLVEMIVVILVLGIIAGSAALLLRSGFRNYFESRDIALVTVPAGLALERMERGIRAAESFSTTTSSTLTFQNTSGQTITYTLSGTDLTRKQDSNPTRVLASNVSALTFSYLTNALVSTTTAANVFYVNIVLTVSRAGSTKTFNATVYPRNIS